MQDPKVLASCFETAFTDVGDGLPTATGDWGRVTITLREPGETHCTRERAFLVGMTVVRSDSRIRDVCLSTFQWGRFGHL